MTTRKIWLSGLWKLLTKTTTPPVEEPFIEATYPDNFRYPDFLETITGYVSWPRPTSADYIDTLEPWANDPSVFWKQPITGKATITDRTATLQGMGGLLKTPRNTLFDGTMYGIPYRVRGTADTGNVPFWWQNISDDITQIANATVNIPWRSGVVRKEGDPNPNPSNDQHSILWDPINKFLYEMIETRPMIPEVGGVKYVSKGMKWDTKVSWTTQSTLQNPQGVIAAKTPFFPMIVKYKDVANGNLQHMSLLFTTNYQEPIAPGSPARKTDGTDPNAPLRSGELLRLTQAKYDSIMATGSTIDKRLAYGWRNYGLMLHDKTLFIPYAQQPEGSIRFSQDNRWPTTQNMMSLTMADLEVVSWT